MNRAQRRAAAKNTPAIPPVAVTWFSNAMFAPTGYGTQTAQAVSRMKRDGHKVAISNNYGIQAMPMAWEGVHHYPMGYEGYSNDVVHANHKHWSAQHPDLPSHLIVLFDAWVLKGKGWDEVPASIWTMVDHLPVPPAVAEVLRKPNITPIAVTKWGQAEIERQDIAAEYIPMAIDTEIYRPTAAWNGMTGRTLMGFDEDHFVVSLINANKGVVPARKAWGENLLAFSIFAARHDDARLYIHTERFGNVGGIQMDPLIKAVGLKDHQYRFVNQYAQHNGIPNEAMAALYTSTDVLLASTMGEGFGLTALEAASCATPVIGNDFSATPELISSGGYLTEGQPWWDPLQFAWFNTPSVPSIVDALEQAYAKGRTRSQEQRNLALTYDADLIWETHWRPYMARLAASGGPSAEPVLLTGSTEPAEQTWTRNEPGDPRLTIYIPTYKRDDLGALLESLEPQLTADVEVIISDNDPAGMGHDIARKWLAHVPCHVHYSRRSHNIGGDANILRGYTAGRADWVWVIGDDDTVLPGAVANILQAIDSDDLDRLILLSRQAPSNAAGMLGTMADLASVEPGLPIAATLISANVLRRSALDMTAAQAHIDTMYGHSWANTTCHRVKVLASPAIGVGRHRVNEFANNSKFTGDVLEVWGELLRDGYGIEPTEASFAWNYVSVQS